MVESLYSLLSTARTLHGRLFACFAIAVCFHPLFPLLSIVVYFLILFQIVLAKAQSTSEKSRTIGNHNIHLFITFFFLYFFVPFFFFLVNFFDC